MGKMNDKPSKEANTKKRKYWNDYLNNIRLSDHGEYSYQGEYYGIKDGDEKISVKSLIVSILMALFSVAGGFFPASGAMDRWYIIIPFALTIIAAGYNLYYVVRWIYNGKTRLKEHIYKKTILRLPVTSRAVSICAGLTLTAEIFYLITYGIGEHRAGVIFLIICDVITCLLSCFLFKLINSKEWLNLAK